MSDQEKIKLKFQPLRDVNERARTCAGCHVGHPGDTAFEVDHDLIAAGHPRLNFDLRAFHERLPEHWDRAADEKLVAQSKRPFQLAVWQAGRRAELLRSLEVLQSQAERAQSGASANWPELSQYSCYACHHDLARGEFRQQLVRAGHQLGQLDWVSWHSAFAELLPQALQQSLAQLTTELNAPSPDPARVVALAKTARAEIANTPIDIDPITLRQQLAAEQYSLMDWDRAKRWWSAWLAATSGMPDSLALRKNMDISFFHTVSGAGPMKDREYSGILDLQFQSPVHFDPTAFQQLRQQVMQAHSQ